MQLRLFAPLAWLVLCSSVILAQDDVGLLRGNAGRTGEFEVSGIDAFNAILWKSPKIYTTLPRPRPPWRFQKPDKVDLLGERARYEVGLATVPLPRPGFGKESMPLVYRRSIFVSKNLEDGFLMSLDVETGKPNWSHRCLKCFVSNPVANGDWVIIASRDHKFDGKIQAFNISTGKPEWSISAEGGSLVTPTVYDGILYFIKGSSSLHASTAQSVHALDLNTRTIKWSFSAKGLFDTPAIAEGLLFAASNKDFLYAVDLVTGKEKWKYKAEAHAPAVRDGVVYFNDFSNIFAVDAKTGSLRWKQKANGTVESALAVSKSTVFYGTERKFWALDAATGSLKWSIKIKGTAFEPVIAGNRVYAGGTDELLMIDADTGKKFRTIHLGANIAYTPAPLDDMLIVSNDDGYFFAIKK